MISLTRTFRRAIGRGVDTPAAVTRAPSRAAVLETPPIDIAPNDPILAYFHAGSGAVAIDDLQLDSPAVRALRSAGVKLVVPLISQGELIGLLNLGRRLSDQDYSTDDRRLLEKLAAQASPAVRVAQLVREQEAEVRARERISQELRVAQLIQQQFLPKTLPNLPGWQIAAFYRAAAEVGGDFYDFIDLPAGKVGLVVGDVTGHGVPAALVMATTRSVLRSEAPRLVSPGKLLERVNDFLHADIPQNMFVTCLYAVLDPATGTLTYANAGHDLPFVRRGNEVVELRATGMPLGALPGMHYDEKEATLAPGDVMVLHSDGLAEAHDPQHVMYGFPRMRKLIGELGTGHELIDGLLESLHAFTGPAWEQEDDITLVTLSRSTVRGESEHVLVEFEESSAPGNERLIMDRVASSVRDVGLDPKRFERLKTAVSEAAMNAIEHGNRLDVELPVHVRVSVTDDELLVRIVDNGGGREIPEPETPDLEAKLQGLQKPRGWGLFLIKNMVDDMRVHTTNMHHSIELVMKLAAKKGADDGHD
ncbi:MAG TPA: SpoIIE family protein phosphatase [Candidatus Limnocylindria bacterium]|jgi:serine phosphatase RsbU (regulator of sigma subunit)/anti-sigma regulatory factor (Ser/Thr protein kinase)|nr:SpoIIE family protein phosphatase [Candidatus Limnocylindria bacterium]